MGHFFEHAPWVHLFHAEVLVPLGCLWCLVKSKAFKVSRGLVVRAGLVVLVFGVSVWGVSLFVDGHVSDADSHEGHNH